MGGASGKHVQDNTPLFITPTQTPVKPAIKPVAYDAKDPRSPSLKRTPVNDWRHKAAAMAHRNTTNQADPRSPGFVRTPLADKDQPSATEPVTPLTLSYGECRKISAEDPRSPLAFRTPLGVTSGIDKYDTGVVACPSFTDDTVVVNALNTSEDKEADVTISASSHISSPLADLSIISSSSEVRPITEEVKADGAERKILVESLLDIEVPSSPLGASACRIEDSSEEKEKKMEKANKPEFVSSPSLLADRKRKKAPAKQLQGVSPLKKSFSSPCMFDNDENASPLVPKKSTPTTPRRSPHSFTRTHRRTTSQSTRSPTQKSQPRTPNTTRRESLKNSTGNGAPRSPLSPVNPRVQREPAPAFVL